MRAHYSTHTGGEKEFRCQESGCAKSFATRSQLNSHHKMKHSDLNPFVYMSNCGRKFGFGINLQKHLKAHEKQKNKTENNAHELKRKLK